MVVKRIDLKKEYDKDRRRDRIWYISGAAATILCIILSFTENKLFFIPALITGTTTIIYGHNENKRIVNKESRIKRE